MGGYLKYSLEADGPADDPIISAPTALAAGLGIAIGFGVWAAAPAAIGQRVPWDGSWPYYSTVLVAASAVVALFLPRRYAAVAIGTALGQLLAELVFIPLGLRGMLTSRYDWIATLLTIPGTWAGTAIRGYFRRAA